MRVSYRNPRAESWHEAILKDPASFPFCFSYGGRLIQGFPDSVFTCVDQSIRQENGKEVTEFCWRKDDCLFVTLRCSFYEEYGVSEWTVWFENRG